MKIVKENKVQEAVNYTFDKARVQKLNVELNDYFYAAFNSYVEEDAMKKGQALNKNIYTIAMALKKEGWI